MMTLAEIRSMLETEIRNRENASRAAFVAARKGETVDPSKITGSMNEANILRRTLATLTARK